MATCSPLDDPRTVIRLLDAQGVWGLDHLRLAGYFNDLVRDGVDRRLRASTALYLTANAHANTALIYLRKLLDRDPRSVGVGYLLNLMERTIGDLVEEMGQRAPELRIDAGELRRRVSDHRDWSSPTSQSAQPPPSR